MEGGRLNKIPKKAIAANQPLIRRDAYGKYLDAQYREMAADEAREQEALEWAETLVGDVADERR